MRLALVLVVALVSGAEAQRVVRPRIAGVDPGAIPPNPSVTITTPTSASTFATTSASLTLAGVAEDNASVASVTWACATCTPTSGTATGTTTWTFNLTLGTGANTITVTATDNQANTGQDSIVVTYSTTVDTTDPVVTITSGSPAGSDFTVTSSSTTLVGSVDEVPTSVAWSRTGASASCGASTSWSCSVTLAEGPQVVTVTACDAAGNCGSDTVTITYVAPLRFTSPQLLPTVRTTDTTTYQLLTTGGTSPITFAEYDDGDGGDVLGAGDCADITMNAAGLVTISTPPTSGVTCAFDVRATDSGVPDIDTEDREFTIVVNDAAETAHALFNTLAALGGSSWTMRSQSVIDGTTNGAGTSSVWTYDSTLDAAKFTIAPTACEPTTVDRSIVSIAAGNPATVTLGATGGISINTSYPITISGHSYAPLNGVATTISIGGTKSIGTIPLEGGGGTGGTAAITTCDCSSPGQTICSPPTVSLDPDEQPRFVMNLSNLTASTMLVMWDAFYEESFRLYSRHKKLWGFVQGDNGETTSGTTTLFLMQNPDAIDMTEGYGAGGSSAGPIGHEIFGTKLIAPGNEERDGIQPEGEGTAVDNRNLPAFASWHPQINTWSRNIVLFETDVPYSDSKFSKYRTLTGTNGTTNITSCTGDDPVVCTLAGATAWDLNGTNPYTPRVTITNHTGLNGVHTATILSDTTFSIARPTGYAGGSGGEVAMHWIALSWWMCDESRACTRLLFRIPWEPKADYLSSFRVAFNSSTGSGGQEATIVGYLRNVVMVPNALSLLSLDLSGTCNTSDTQAGSDRGNCTVDATNNSSYFKKPVR
jgi:hypothetical protein